MKDAITLYLGVARRTLYTLTLGLFRQNSREELLKLYNAAQPVPDVPQFPVDPYIIPKTDILALSGNDKARYSGVDACGFGHITEFELKAICQLVLKYEPKRIFEIGTFQGRTTLNMALNAPEAQIYTLDLPSSQFESTKLRIAKGEESYIQKEVSGERFHNHPAEKNIQQLFGDSASFDFTPYYGTIDLTFIDGSHAYEYVKNDTEAALKLTRKGGVILWHDYTNWDGVRQALNEYYQTQPRFKGLEHIGGTSIVMMEV